MPDGTEFRTTVEEPRDGKVSFVVVAEELCFDKAAAAPKC
jgi:hypothetical protein